MAAAAPPRVNLLVPVNGGSEPGISPDVLALFRAVPVGGTRGPSVSDILVSPDRVALHTPDAPPLDVPIRFIILAQPPSPPSALSGSDAPSAEGQDPANQNPADHSAISDSKMGPNGAAPWLKLWKRALDEFFRMDWSGRFLHEWFQSLPLLQPGANLPTQAGVLEDGAAEEEDLEAVRTIPAGDDLLDGSTLSLVGAAALPALGLLTRRDSDKPRHPRLGRPSARASNW